MELADRMGIQSYESPAGGCLLTDENFARAMHDLKDHEGLSDPGVRLLSVGRQFRLSDTAKLAVGRNHSENERLFSLDLPDAIYVKAVACKGPVGVVTGSPTPADEQLAGAVVARYADTGDAASIAVEIKGSAGLRTVDVVPLTSKEVRKLAVK